MVHAPPANVRSVTFTIWNIYISIYHEFNYDRPLCPWTPLYSQVVLLLLCHTSLAIHADSPAHREKTMDRVDYESLIIQDLLGYFDRDELNISPWYQRRSVWSRAQKAYLINTIHENKPVPSIYIRHAVDLATEKSIKEVVDGQQRVRCVIEYRDNMFPARHPQYLKSLHFSDLKPRERIHFLQSSLSVGYLVGATDSNVMEIFARINSIAKTLNPQEKRNAQYSGAFKEYCLQEAVERLTFWRENRIFTDIQISRMFEVQFVADLVMNLAEGLQDFSAKILDNYYKINEDEFPMESEVKERLERAFTVLLDLPEGLLRSTIFSVPQLLFSLIVVIDSTPTFKTRALKQCVVDLDARVEAVRTGESTEALKTEVYGSFKSGNLHRIRSRKMRDTALRDYLR